MFSRQLSSSPKELREGAQQNLDTYHPKPLVRQNRIDSSESSSVAMRTGKMAASSKETKSSWLVRMSSIKSHRSLRDRLSKKMARLSSLDSTHTSSSIDLDSMGNSRSLAANQPTPLISITTSAQTDSNRPSDGQASERQRFGYHNDGLRSFDLTGEQLDEDEDEFEDPPLAMPYSLSSTAARTFTGDNYEDEARANFQSAYEDLLDDRQGMNNSEQQFTKGEKMGRASLDGSIASELTSVLAKKNSKGSKKDKQRRSKSPSSSMSNVNRRSSRHRRGFFGLASRLKLTRKHEPIAMLQLSILNSGFVSLKTMDRNLQSFLPRDRLTSKEFEQHVKMMHRFEVLAHIEYRFASRYETYVCRHATQESNQPKNNYKRCIPYDYNRVVLKTLPNVPDSDYINASHVDSYLKPNAYIAAQGPNENTIEDFWRMIWEQKTFVIVMLTKVFDFIRVMCNQYWPVELNKPERYGNLEVTLLCEEPLADFVIRTIRLTKLRPSQAANAIGQQLQQNDRSGSDRDRTSSSDSEEGDSAASVSESELVLDDRHSNGLEDNSVLTVRAPKYRISRRKRGHSSTVEPSNELAPPTALVESPTEARPPRELHLPLAQAYSNSNEDATGRLSPKRPNEFLYPPVSTPHSTTIGSGTPGTPSGSQVSPRTPSTAGLDRSSATRRAVKKKRRERVKDARLMRTQFQAPTESLFDEDDEGRDDNEDEPGEANDIERGDGGEEEPRAHNERIIYQFHYNSWASHTCPFVNSLLHFRRRVRICMDEMSKSRKTGPTVVHCNDGCGRTGTYLCIDANLELAEEDNVYDVFNYTKKMRQSRKFLIENLEQYKFVYDTIEEAMLCGKTWFPVSELHKRLKHKSQKNPITKKNEYQREYEKITKMATKFSIGDCAGGHRVENREKNRDVSTVPPDNFRPYLTSFQSNDSTDYINAVFVDGYTRSKEYIVTEWPVHRTISDFWSLVYDHDCNSVILLANPCESFAYPSFLPSEKELRRKFGPVFSAEMVSYTHYQNIKSWIYTINKKIVSLTEVIAGVKSEAKTTQVFQITCWPQGHRVPTSTNALVELMNMVERWRQRTAYGPVCVVSLNGKSRAGVYCAANVAIEQVVQHSEVDVFQAVKTVRRHRPQLIENMTEYKYCYDLILHYVLHYVNRQTTT